MLLNRIATTSRALSPSSTAADIFEPADPVLPPKYDYWVWYWENKLDRLIELLLGIYLEKHADFDRRKATEEVISDIKQDTGKYWRLAPKSVARAIKCDIVALRVPDAPNREDEFWSRVTDAINEALR